MSRHVHPPLPHPSPRRGPWVFATSVLVVTVLPALGLPVSGCEHADAVKKLEEMATQGTGAGGTEQIGPVEGTLTWQDLTGTETPVGADSYAGTPLVDEEGRTSCGNYDWQDTYVPDPAVQSEAQSLMLQMDINQKVLQLTGIAAPDYNDSNRWEDIQRSRDDEALNLQGYQWRDGPHGLNLEAGQGRDPLLNYSTSFPTSVAQGATFDVDVVGRMGEAMGDEVVAAGMNVLLAPCMNVLRHPFWGRAQETFGEDTFHLGRIGAAYTRGLQQYITGCAKHYTANNIENRRFHISSDMDEQTLREVYGRHFEMVVREGGVGCVMASYNLVNGKKSTQNHHTLTEMLRDDMGFKGFVLTDWWAMPGANNGQGPVDPPLDGANSKEAIEAGLDVEVPWAINFDAIPGLVADGSLQVDVVNRAVLRVLEQKLRFNSAYIGQPHGLKAPTVTYNSTSGALEGTQAHADLAQEVAEKGMVLLKNENNVLPITGVGTVAVVGASVDYFVRSDNPQNKVFNFVTDAALGDRGSSRVRPDPALTTGPLAGIQAAAQRAGVNVISGATAADAASADFVVVVVGNTPGDEGEEYTGASDRESLALRPEHDALVSAVAALNKPMVVVVESGGVVSMPWIDSVDAAIMAWYPGQRGGAALGRLLFGETNFAGRLPVTWPMSEAQLPVFNEGEATFMDYYVGYRRFDVLNEQPLYAFGHGLSYSTFRYERIHIPCGNVGKYGLIQVEVDVRNVAGPAGDEVVFVFASYPGTQARRSVKELKGFYRVHLEPGEGKRVSIPIRVQDLKYWNQTTNAWAVDPGPVELKVGPSSDNLLLQQTVTID